MKLMDVVRRTIPPEPWAEGDKIPWHDPDFSRRMLREHLSQQHDAASRRVEIIDRQVAWIHHALLRERPSRILDLGCGPGLYANRLAALGHEAAGIDFSPASVAYARERAQEQGLRCRYVLDDVRRADFGGGYALVMFIYGEFNVFRPEDVRAILAKAHAALDPGGLLLLEVSTSASVRRLGHKPSTWVAAESGLFSDGPHLCLTEGFWDAQHAVATERYYILDAVTGDVTRHAISTQAYTDAQYRTLLRETGFRNIIFYPSLTGEGGRRRDMFAIVAQKEEAQVAGPAN